MNHQVRRSAFATENPAQGLAVLDEVFAVRGVRRAEAGSFAMGLSTVATGAVSYERTRLRGTSATGRTEGAGVLRVCQVTNGVLAATSGGDRFPRRGPFLFPQRTFTSWWEELEAITVTLDPAVVADHARGLLSDPAFRLEFTGTRPVSEAMGRYWLATVAHVQRDLLPNDHVMNSPLVQGEIARSLATALLHTFPSTFLDRPQGTDGSTPVCSGVRRAVAFIEEHLAEDIGLAEIAAAARMSPRGLQVAFRREKGTTPTAHLREARLDAAHQELLVADPTTGATVESIALRWGFPHRGRFAAAYRDRHGRSPAATLRA